MPAPSTWDWSAIPEALNRVNAHLYSDLLLYNMGEELTDNRPDVSAGGRQWRHTAGFAGSGTTASSVPSR